MDIFNDNEEIISKEFEVNFFYVEDSLSPFPLDYVFQEIIHLIEKDG